MTLRIVKFGKLIERKREALGLTQTQLAKKLRVSQAAVSAWESGIYRPRDMATVRKVLGIKPEEYRAVVVPDHEDPVAAALVAATDISAADRDALLTLYRTAVEAHRTKNDES